MTAAIRISIAAAITNNLFFMKPPPRGWTSLSLPAGLPIHPPLAGNNFSIAFSLIFVIFLTMTCVDHLRNPMVLSARREVA
jgi:hypothetical protein